MQPAYNTVIADTSCFILLDKIGMLSILQSLFQRISTTEEIKTEYGRSLPEWVSIKPVTDKRYQHILELEVDKGEAGAIALVLESEPALLIVDDLKARKLAERLGLSYTGTMGLFLKAKERGYIEKIKPFLNKIQSTNFRLPDKLYHEMLAVADEV